MASGLAASSTHRDGSSDQATDTAQVNTADTEPATQDTSAHARLDSHHAGQELAQRDVPIDQPREESVDPIAKEDYSTFTVGQKRAIVLAGSFAGWFRYADMCNSSRTIAHIRQPNDWIHLFPSSVTDSERLECFRLADQHHCNHVSGRSLSTVDFPVID